MAGHVLNLQSSEPTEQKVAFLKRADSYPIETSGVSVIESHMAFVFLTDRFAFKLKKPVKNTYLDFSTVARRKVDCAREVQLNRRLAANVYYGMVPLFMEKQDASRFRLGECQDTNGPSDAAGIVDWLVMMRRLPASLMLDVAIRNRTVDERAVDEVGMLLARFYRHNLPIRIAAEEYLQRLAGEIVGNQVELVLKKDVLPAPQIADVVFLQKEFLATKQDLLAQRVSSQRIVDGHGDLRPEHVCLEHPPVIIDCLEFSRGLRILDAVSDLSFLSLECERLEAPAVGQRILETYAAHTEDYPDQALWNFYRSHHAMSRAKIAIWHLDIPGIENPDQWIMKSRQYLDLAESLIAP